MLRRKPLHAHLHKLHGVRLKINRAQTHADALNDDIAIWLKNHPYGLVGKYEPGPPELYEFRVRFLDHVPPDWAIVLGDFVHNARSALDHLAYLVVMEGNGGMDERTQFPIVVCAADFPRQARRHLKGASARHIEIIESLQPYQRRDPQGWYTIWSATEDPLAILNSLSNIDKHRVLNATPAAVESIGWDFEVVRDIESIGSSQAQMGMLVEDEPLVTVDIVSNGPNPELKLQRTEHVDIAVQYRVDIGPDGHLLLRINLKKAVQDILGRLGEVFEVFVNEFG